MKKRTKRKIWALVNPIQHAMEGACITSADKLDQLHMRELSALSAFVSGHARLVEWKDLAAANNIAMTLAGMGVGKAEVFPVCHQAEAELITAAERYKATGRMGLTGPGLQVMRALLELHHTQRLSIPRRQYEEAIRLATARVKNGFATLDMGVA